MVRTEKRFICVSRPRRRPAFLSEYFGFTEDEISKLCSQYGMESAEIQKWYDGYLLAELHIYNPKSVSGAVRMGKCRSYRTGTETYEALKIYIDRNFDGLKEAVIQMLGNGGCKINARKFQNDMTTFKTRDDVLTLLPLAKSRIPSWHNLHVLTYFAVNAKYWAELLHKFSRIITKLFYFLPLYDKIVLSFLYLKAAYSQMQPFCK